LTANTRYEFRVAAKTSVGTSVFTEPVAKSTSRR